MNAPPVQYVTTPDGYDIAYAVWGDGPTLVLTPPALHHIQIVWGWPSRRAWLEGLAQRFRVVQFDPRGQGMSTRGLRSNFSMEDYVSDLETVIDHLRLERFVLASTCLFAHASLRYASRFPDRLDALLLLTVAGANNAWPLDEMAGLGRENWELLLWSRLPPGLPSREAETRMAEIERMITREDACIRWVACVRSDVTDLLPHLRTPTLVLHPRDFIHLRPAEAVKLAAAIPGARLALIDSNDPGDLYGMPDASLAAIDDFMASLALQHTSAGVQHQPRSTLSARQAEVLRLIAAGKTNREIAEELVVSLRTVERHVEDLYVRINVRNRSEATAYALGHLANS